MSPAHYTVPKEHNIPKDAQRSLIVQVQGDTCVFNDLLLIQSCTYIFLFSSSICLIWNFPMSSSRVEKSSRLLGSNLKSCKRTLSQIKCGQIKCPCEQDKCKFIVLLILLILTAQIINKLWKNNKVYINLCTFQVVGLISQIIMFRKIFLAISICLCFDFHIHVFLEMTILLTYLHTYSVPVFYIKWSLFYVIFHLSFLLSFLLNLLQIENSTSCS